MGRVSFNSSFDHLIPLPNQTCQTLKGINHKKLILKFYSIVVKDANFIEYLELEFRNFKQYFNLNDCAEGIIF